MTAQLSPRRPKAHSDLLPRRPRKPYRPSFEGLEERQMLADGLGAGPLPITVGRVLSSPTASGVVNNELTVTYTVYNEQGTELSGVLLTTTLQPGVTFRDG